MRLRRRFLWVATALGVVLAASLVGAATAPPITALAFGGFALASVFLGGLALTFAWFVGPPPPTCGACGGDLDAGVDFCPGCGVAAPPR